MACITISGYPSSGKSRRAQELKTFLEAKIAESSYEGPAYKVEVISDDGLSIQRTSYDSSLAEKPARSAFLAATIRQLDKNTILILDSMNYIKGYRYQIYCAAREVGVRVCTLHVVATAELCRGWNMQENADPRYASATLNNLVQRYEEPSSMVRWDSPLFTIPWDEKLPNEDIWKAIFTGEKKPPNAAVQAIAVAPTDALQILEQTSASLVSLIIAAQTDLRGLGTGGPVTVTLPSKQKIPMILPARNVTLSELQRVKRQFVSIHKKAMSQSMAGKGALDWSEITVAKKFVDYLEENLKS